MFRFLSCQLLDWNSADDVVVGEGEFCSIEQTYKIGRIQLGPNAAAVIVKSVLKEEAYMYGDLHQAFSHLGKLWETKLHGLLIR